LPGCRWHKADMLDPVAAAQLIERVRPSHLLHLAWTTAHGRFWDDPANADWRDATLALLAAFSKVGGRRFVTAGSCAEYVWEGTAPLSEAHTPLRPSTLYGQAKLEAFRRVQTASEPAGISYAHGRLFYSYGPFEQPQRLVPGIIRALLKNEPARLTDGTQRRDFLDVRDVGGCLAALLASEVAGAVNIASGVPTAVARIAELLAGIVGRPDLIELGAVARPAGDPASIVGDNRRLLAEVGAAPAIPLESGLAAAVDWWRGRV
ncbi:MAG TPA: NAD(P)-dependent oxidoreductase, partial [Methylomirabilota bacterium]|nr:NAD(P)-dependent oxidoreductase [Methylomirabilota bacterium]